MKPIQAHVPHPLSLNMQEIYEATLQYFSTECGSDGASTNLMLAAFGQLAFGYVGTGPKGGKKCNKLRDANNRLIAAGGCSSGKGKRSIADVIPFYSRYRRQVSFSEAQLQQLKRQT